jgi:myo-inositol-1-phosphate synthase
VLDLVLLLDLAQRAGFSGIQEWLSFYFKSPMTAPSVYPEHDLFIQLTKLKNTMRWMMGEQTLSHLGHEYYRATGPEVGNRESEVERGKPIIGGGHRES